MPDFTSALYLGIEHGSRQLAGWTRLTLGKPAALASPPGAADVERELASLVGCEDAVLATSTLHVFHDLLPLLSRRGFSLYVDEGLYPIGMWGVERAAALGTPVVRFPRHDAKALWQAIENARTGRPMVVADGFCAACGTAAPLRSYIDCVAHREGLIVLDDTQALGIMGFDAKSEAPYGSGGGGSLRLAGLRDPRVVLVSSLAKAFGAPVAMAAGSRHVISEYRDSSATRMHCSPPSVASIAAAAHALAVNARCGDALRCALAHRVARFRRGLGPLAAAAGAFPVQHLRLPVCTDPTRVHARLRKRGVQTVLSRVESARASIAFVLTARHADHEIDEALDALATATRTGTTRAGWGGGSANGR